MCCDNREQLLDQLNPTFLFTWKGTRLKDEARYHSHDFIEMAFILSGHGKYKIADRLYDVSEGDIIILNPGQKHQALCTDPANPTTEFFVGLCDVRFPDFPENYLPLHLKDLTKVTGYVRGGCTAIGMKKQFPTVIQEDAKELEYMHVSGGKLGMQIRLAPLDLQKVAKAEFADVIRP